MNKPGVTNTIAQNIFTSPNNKSRTGGCLVTGVKQSPRRFPRHYRTKTHDNPDDNIVTIWVVITPTEPQGESCPPDARPPSPNDKHCERGVERREGRKKESGCEERE